jgi:hypothetical protein
MRVIDERRDVAALLAGAVAVPDLVDDNLRTIAIAVLALRGWRALVSVTVEDLVRALGGDASEVEQLRREGALRRRG